MDFTIRTQPAATDSRWIGPVGIASRAVVGIGFLGVAALTQEPELVDAVVGLVAFPAVASGCWDGGRAASRPASMRPARRRTA